MAYSKMPSYLSFEIKEDREEAARLVQRTDDFVLTEVHKFLSPQECERLIQYAEANDLRPSLTDNGLASHRTSSQTWIDRYSTNCDVQDIVDKIKVRCKLLTGQDDEAYFESLQLVRYREGEQFKKHTDGHSRRFTVNIYLNDDFLGGETAFPCLNKKVKPEAGKAVIWQNMTVSGATERKSEHIGCKILSGQKYICTQWIKSDDFFWK